MKKLFVSCAAAALSLTGLSAVEAPKVGVVNFKSCVELSKAGKQEQANFEAMKKQMETILAEKEKTLNELATKFNDADYMDGLAPDAEKEMKHKFRTLNQELGQQQNQYHQMLNQAQMKVLQKLSELVAKSSEDVAKAKKLDIVVNDESCFYCVSTLDISKDVVTKMDEISAKEAVKP